MSKDAVEYIQGNSATETKDDGTVVTSMTQKTYLGWMNSQGLETPVLKAADAAERDLITGAMLVGSQNLAEAAKKAREAGDDPSGLSAVVSIARHNGGLKVEVHGHERPRNVSTGEILDQYGRVKVRANTNRLIDQPTAQTVAANIKAAMTS